jgi:hypothetical protein
MGDRPERQSPIFIGATMTSNRTDTHTVVLPFGEQSKAKKTGVKRFTHMANGRR